LLTAQRVLAAAGLTVVDIEELPTHGGSMRLWSVPSNGFVDIQLSVKQVLAEEAAAGWTRSRVIEGLRSRWRPFVTTSWSSLSDANARGRGLLVMARQARATPC
jgi:hypothetical protein